MARTLILILALLMAASVSHAQAPTAGVMPTGVVAPTATDYAAGRVFTMSVEEDDSTFRPWIGLHNPSDSGKDVYVFAVQARCASTNSSLMVQKRHDGSDDPVFTGMSEQTADDIRPIAFGEAAAGLSSEAWYRGDTTTHVVTGYPGTVTDETFGVFSCRATDVQLHDMRGFPLILKPNDFFVFSTLNTTSIQMTVWFVERPQ